MGVVSNSTGFDILPELLLTAKDGRFWISNTGRMIGGDHLVVSHLLVSRSVGLEIEGVLLLKMGEPTSGLLLLRWLWELSLWVVDVRLKLGVVVASPKKRLFTLELSKAT
ncbi:hypothetical protein G6F37_013746 [Rhizopus arrhizus]|nr:hypothetical protein G6F38_013675 [Rhizopus arrhizus]KAG1136332.1 hypothetical protein G6F37_013746 [Rhizopus arrhizus]